MNDTGESAYNISTIMILRLLVEAKFRGKEADAQASH